ncbi:MAG: hypothetical protein JEY79_12275 [Pseudodesulfovibrio sp.]|nr:hypothetical protein [Pseudodesulfovibrio sp.]
MFKKIAISLLVIALSISAFGCAKMGEATGKAIKEVKEMPGEFHDGYSKGRNSEEDKN